MRSLVVKLPSVNEIRQRLAKVQFDSSVNKEKFIAILIEYAGRELTGRGIVNLLQEVTVMYGPVGTQKSYDPLISKFQDVIEALVTDQRVQGDALKTLRLKTYM